MKKLTKPRKGKQHKCRFKNCPCILDPSLITNYCITKALHKCNHLRFDNIKPKTLDNLEVGDVVVDREGRKFKILAVIEKLIALEPADGYGTWVWHTVDELGSFGYLPITNSKCPCCGK